MNPGRRRRRRGGGTLDRSVPREASNLHFIVFMEKFHHLHLCTSAQVAEGVAVAAFEAFWASCVVIATREGAPANFP